MSERLNTGSIMEDKLLVFKCKRGNADALRRIYEKYRENLLIIAGSILHDSSEAEDVVQEVFAKFIDKLGSFELRRNLKGFLGVCAANAARDRNRLIKKTVGIDVVAETTSQVESALDGVIFNEQAMKLRAAMSVLSDEQREVVLLHVRTDMSLRQIAAQLELPTDTVKSRYRYAMAKLRARLLEVET